MIVAGCGEDIARIELVIVPNGTDDCGLFAGTTLQITALAETGVYPSVVLSTTDEPTELADFPPDTRQLTLEVRDSNAMLRTHGKTAPFLVEARPAQVPISLYPVGGTCTVGPLAAPRRRPTVTALSDGGALVIGGYTVEGSTVVPVETIEYFDPLRNAFEIIPPRSDEVKRFVGGSIATLTDGRVVLTGGDSSYYVVWDPAQKDDPETHGFDRAGVFEARALAQVAAVDDHRVVIAGGCTDLRTDGSGLCDGALASVKLLDVDTGVSDPLTNLSGPRAGGIAVVQHVGGIPTVVVAGGVDATGAPVTTVDRIRLDGLFPIESTDGAPGLAAELDTGGVLTALGPPGALPASTASITVPGVLAPRPIAAAVRSRRDAVLVALEDGSVIAVGGVDDLPGSPAGQLMRYSATRDAWDIVGGVPDPAWLDHAATRLADGSILIVGGRDATDTALATARRYRPALLGPFAATAAVTPAIDVDSQLIPFDPMHVDRTAGTFALTATTQLDGYALIGGPRLASGTLSALITANAVGGVGLLARVTAPGNFIRGVLIQGQPARVERWVDGVVTTLCTGSSTVPTLATAMVEMTVEADRLVLRRAGLDPDVECGLESAAVVPGQWGIAAVDAGARVEVTTISVER